MACNSITPITISCGTALSGGFLELLVIAHKDLKKLANGLTYEYDATSKLIDEIGIKDDVAFVNIGIYTKASNGANFSIAKDDAVGYLDYTHTVSFQLRDLTQQNKEFIQNTANQPVAFVYKDRSGNWFASGLDGDMTMETAEGGVGMVATDGRSFNLTFTGSDSEIFKPVDPSIITTITTPVPSVP